MISFFLPPLASASGAAPATTSATTTPSPMQEKVTKPAGGRKKVLVPILAVLAIAGGGYWFLLRPAPEPSEPEPGEVLALEAIQVNLKAGHYLRVGIALQMTDSVAHAPDGSKALDATIELFSGQDMADLGKAKERHQLKEELMEHLDHAYHGDVMGVYFTEFVTQ